MGNLYRAVLKFYSFTFSYPSITYGRVVGCTNYNGLLFALGLFVLNQILSDLIPEYPRLVWRMLIVIAVALPFLSNSAIWIRKNNVYLFHRIGTIPYYIQRVELQNFIIAIEQFSKETKELPVSVYLVNDYDYPDFQSTEISKNRKEIFNLGNKYSSEVVIEKIRKALKELRLIHEN